MNTNNDLNLLKHPETAPAIKANAKPALAAATPASQSPSTVETNPKETVKPSAKAKPKAATANATGGGFVVSDKGVWFKGEDEDSAGQWVCARLDVPYLTRDALSGQWGSLVKFSDSDNKHKEVNIFAADLVGDGSQAIRKLAGEGLRIASGLKGKQRLLDYLQRAAPIDRATIVEAAGWQGGSFLLGDKVIGGSEDKMVFIAGANSRVGYGQQGSLDQWRQEIAALCVGNPLLVFCVSLAFAGPLIKDTNTESGGFHLCENSGRGKSTTQQVACSVWGDWIDVKKSWRATDSSLEITAAAHSDSLLVLDEIAECDPFIIDKAIYMLGNGTAKARFTKDAPPAKWRILFLSSGEVSLQDHLASVGKKMKDGLEQRMLSLAVGGEIFKNTHRLNDGKLFSEHMKNTARRFFGTPGMTFLSELSKQRTAIAKEVTASIQTFAAKHVPPGSDNQIGRAATRFALVGIAGEIATRWGITGWAEGVAMKAAVESFEGWLSLRGTSGSLEDREMLHRLAAFLEQHGEARFTRLSDENTSDADNHRGKTLARCGYRKITKGPLEENPKPGFSVNGEGEAVHVTYYVFAQAWGEEIFKGMNKRRVNKVLSQWGIIKPGQKGEASHSPRAAGLHKVECPGRVYMVNGDMLSCANGGYD